MSDGTSPAARDNDPDTTEDTAPETTGDPGTAPAGDQLEDDELAAILASQRDPATAAADDPEAG